ncbi:MAG: hypothetical protein ACE1ZL_05185, partial [Gammaproteobacteria bacterium]
MKGKSSQKGVALLTTLLLVALVAILTVNLQWENLRAAVAMNPYLHVMIQSGYYDGATQYFNAKYTL